MTGVEKSLLEGEDDALPLPSPLLGTRHLVLLVALFAMTAARSNDLSFTFTIICMAGNGTSQSSIRGVSLSPREASLSFAGAGVGALLACLAIAWLLNRAGGRLIFPVVLCISAAATSALPSFAHTGLTALLPLRFAQGIAVAGVMPMIGFISASWAPLSEIGTFVTILSAAGQLSHILTMPLSAGLCVHVGWPWTYYVHATIALLAAATFLFFFRNSPESHPFITPAELAHIQKDDEHRRHRKNMKVPYMKIALTPSVWAVWVAFFGNAVGFQLVSQFMPTYLHGVLGVPISHTGFSAIIPPCSQLVVKVLAGFASDRILCVSERRKLQLFNSLALAGCGFWLLPIGWLAPSSAGIAVFCFTASISSLALVTVGSMKSVTLVARQFSHIVMGVVQFVICLGMLGVPLLVTSLAPSNTQEEWRVVFSVACLILLLSNFFFCWNCESVAAAFTRSDPLSNPQDAKDPAKSLLKP